MFIHINEPFWGAYTTYGWGDKIPGIGFKAKLVDTLATMHEKLIVTVGKDKTKYQISAITIQNLAKKYHSVYKARYNTELYVIPQNKLIKIS